MNYKHIAVLACVVISAVAFVIVCIVRATQDNTTTSSYAQLKATLEEEIAQNKSKINQRYRLHYHIAGPVGWINDPNGFSTFNGTYHMFYQYYPYDSVWGPMHWGHVTSNDLVNWEQQPTALLPETEYCFSGSAIEVENNTQILIYTAHIITNASNTDEYYQIQYLAMSTDGVNYDKYDSNPVLDSGQNGSPDFRDPKVWKHEDYYYVVIGTKATSGINNGSGAVHLYRSPDMYHWEYLSVIIQSDGDLGYMLECPDFFELDGKFVLLMSPQGMKPVGDRYKNTYQTGYLIGSFSYDTFQFVPEVGFQELDYGHDFYASQTTESDGKRYVVGWFNMWEVPHPEDGDGWCGALTLIRELSIVNNRLNMKPVDAMVDLREDFVYIGNWSINHFLTFNKTAEIIVDGDLSANISIQFEGTDGGNQSWVRWDYNSGKVVVDRGNDDVRQVTWDHSGSTSWRIFLDASSLELFCGDGEAVFSSRLYPDGGWKVTNVSPQVLTVKAFTLKRSVPV